MTDRLTRDELETLHEGWDFEAKRAGGRDGGGAVPTSFWDTYSAMANTEGGYIALGVRERGNRLELCGVPDPDRLVRQLFDQLNDRDKVSVNVIRREHVQLLRAGERSVVVVHVPRATRSQRPVYLGRDPFSAAKHAGAYIRVHEGDRKLPEERVRRMFSDAESPDSQILENFVLGDFHAESVAAFRNLLSAQRRDHPFLREDNAGFLRAIRAWGRDRDRGHEGPTVGGLLMLGRESAIRDRFPGFLVTYQEVDENQAPGTRWVDRVYPDGTWNANLLEFYFKAIRKLHERLKVPFALDPDLFRRDETPVHEALREALVNALIHADYSGRSGVRIIRRARGFELINPGGLLIPAKQVWAGGTSEPRNETLHHLFTLLNLSERAGSGGPKIRDAWREQHWRPPSIWEDAELGETHLVLSNESLLPADALGTLQGRFPWHFGELDEGGRILMATALVEGEVDHARLVEATGLHPRDVTVLLQKLKGWGMIEQAGESRGSPYRLPPESGRSSSQHSGPSLQHSVASFQHTEGSFPHSEESSPHSTDPAVEFVRARRRAPRPAVEAAIAAECAGGYRTVPELAAALARTPGTLRNHYLTPMVAAGRLLMRYPDAANHPQQAYRTVHD
jgi:predicted HTH transcriptional regulator